MLVFLSPVCKWIVMSVLYVKMENYPNFFLSEGKSIVSDNTCILDIQVKVDIQEKNELHLQINDHIHNVDHPSNCVPYINIDIKATTSMTSSCPSLKNWMLYCSNQFISLFDKMLDYGNFSKIRKSSPESIFFNVFFWVLGKIKCTITYCSYHDKWPFLSGDYEINTLLSAHKNKFGNITGGNRLDNVVSGSNNILLTCPTL
jgi:hypothetical protein